MEFLRLACWMSLCARSLIFSIFISVYLSGRRIFRRLFVISSVTRVKLLCVIL